MKKRLSTALSLLVCLAMGLAAVPAAAAEPMTNDYHYYSLTFDQIESSNQSLNDPNWLKWLSVGDAEEAGVSCSWNDAVRNVRVQFPGEMDMDGFHAVFRNLEYTKGVIAFSFCERYMYGEYLENPSSNYLAALPTVLTLDLSNGRVQTYAAKPLTTVDSSQIINTVLETSSLTAANLAGKEWGVRFEKNSDDPNNVYYEVTIADVTMEIPSEYLISLNSTLDPSECYFVINCFASGGNTFSLDVLTMHSGDQTCADDPESAQYLETARKLAADIDAIGEITYDKGTAIKAAKELYDNLPHNIRSLIYNYSTLEEAVNVFEVVEMIHNIGTVTLDSEETFADIDDAYKGLTDSEKLLVTNYGEYTEAKTEFLRLKLRDEIENVPNNEEPDDDEPDTPGQIVTPPDGEQGQPADGTPQTDNENITMEEPEPIIRTTTVTETITNPGSDGRGYIWIIGLAAGVVVLAAAAVIIVFVVLDKKKHRGEENR